jgi:hypothetical protein
MYEKWCHFSLRIFGNAPIFTAMNYRAEGSAFLPDPAQGDPA